MARSKQQEKNSERYYRRKVDRALHYLELANEFQRLSISPRPTITTTTATSSASSSSSSSSSSTQMTIKEKVRAKKYDRRFGKVSNTYLWRWQSVFSFFYLTNLSIWHTHNNNIPRYCKLLRLQVLYHISMTVLGVRIRLHLGLTHCVMER